MNEMKDQLNTKIGDISSRAIRVQHQVNLKKNQRPSNVKAHWGYYATLVAFIGVLVLSINLFSSPFTDDTGQLNPLEPSESAVTPTDEMNESAATIKGEHHAILTKYFFEDGTEAVFEGGFENGGVSVQTFWLNEHYVQQIMSSNGGSYERMYRLSGDQIELVYDEMINEISPTQWEMADLEKLPVLDVILKAPFKVGESFRNWTVEDTKEELATSYGNFKNVVVVGSIIDDVKITKYFAQGFGEVKVETATFNTTLGVYETMMSMELTSVEQMATSFNNDSESLQATHTYYNMIRGSFMSILLWSMYTVLMAWFVLKKKLKLTQAFLSGFAFASIASIALAQNYTVSLIPEANDGIAVSNFLAKFLLPDDRWTVELFFTQFQLYLGLSLILILLYFVAVLFEKKTV